MWRNACSVIPEASGGQTVRNHEGYYNVLSYLYGVIAEPFEGPLRRKALALFQPRHGEKLLEIGIGTGHAMVFLARAVGETGKVWGVDLAEGMIERSRRRLRRKGFAARAELKRADAVDLPLAPNTMDGVFMSFTLELFAPEDAIRVLFECRRVLRPGGRLTVVGLSRERESVPRTMYETARAVFPRLLDCHPIRVAKSIENAGFTVRRTTIDYVAGIPVELVLAEKPVEP